MLLFPSVKISKIYSLLEPSSSKEDVSKVLDLNLITKVVYIDKRHGQGVWKNQEFFQDLQDETLALPAMTPGDRANFDVEKDQCQESGQKPKVS